MAKLIIVGVSKCGTTSLEKYLKDQGNDVIAVQNLATLDNGTLIYKNHYSDRRPVLIFREIHKRAESYIKCFFLTEKKIKDDGKPFVNYKNIVSQWVEFNPLIYDLEVLLLSKDFPHLNRSQ